jgi:hypothetical protein
MASRRIASGTAITSRQRSQRRRDIKAKVSRIYFRADAGFANPEVYEFLEAERIKYAIRLPANRVLQGRIGRLLKRPVGRPPNEVRQFHANFSYQAGSWTKWTRLLCRMFAQSAAFQITELVEHEQRVIAGAGTMPRGGLRRCTRSIHWPDKSARAERFSGGTLATPEPIRDWSLTSLKEKLIKIGAKVVKAWPLRRLPPPQKIQTQAQS